MSLVLVLKFVDLKHGLDTSISSFGEDAKNDIAFIDEVVNFFDWNLIFIARLVDDALQESLVIIHEVNAEQVLVFHKSPALFQSALNKPDFVLCYLKSFVRL